MNLTTSQPKRKLLSKSLTGIQGLDEITTGGFPTGRPTLICGNAGCGKTLLAMEFLVREATVYNEPGVFMAFEETEKELSDNVKSMGYAIDSIGVKRVVIAALTLLRNYLFHFAG